MGLEGGLLALYHEGRYVEPVEDLLASQEARLAEEEARLAEKEAENEALRRRIAELERGRGEA